MYKVLINGKEFQVTMDGSLSTLNGKDFEGDILEYKKGLFHVIRNNRSYRAEVIGQPGNGKSFVIRVNDHDYLVVVKDKYDVLLHELGLDLAETKKVNTIVAPMPGLVLKVMVEKGQAIQKGDSILILEAMKMENVLKAPSDAIVNKLHVVNGDKVEKSQVLIDLG